jgi:hypothetical protein
VRQRRNLVRPEAERPQADLIRTPHFRLKLVAAYAVTYFALAIAWLDDGVEAMAYYAGFTLGAFVALGLLDLLLRLQPRRRRDDLAS